MWDAEISALPQLLILRPMHTVDPCPDCSPSSSWPGSSVSPCASYADAHTPKWVSADPQTPQPLQQLTCTSWSPSTQLLQSSHAQTHTYTWFTSHLSYRPARHSLVMTHRHTHPHHCRHTGSPDPWPLLQGLHSDTHTHTHPKHSDREPLTQQKS